MNKVFIICLALVLNLSGCQQASETSNNQQTMSEEPASTGNEYGFYIGTYTNESSKGIYYAVFNADDGSMSAPLLAASTGNPSYLAKNDTHLFAVNENNDSGLITSFAIGDDHMLKEEGSTSSEGMYPCYISVKDDLLLVANYGGGNVLSVALTEDSQFGITKTYPHNGTGPNTERQEAPHAHSIIPMPGTDFALSADLGSDKVYQYKVKDDGLELVDSIAITAGAGPRHIAYHPRLPVMYVINELNSTIEVYLWNKENNDFKQIEIVSTLPAGYEGENYCADIHVHPSGRYLFASNRGHGSIASYEIGDSGMLELKGHFTEGVRWPRNFAISPDGGYLVIANQQGTSVITASIEQTGVLTATGHSIDISQPSCILFE